jgi:uncharacterized protein
LIASPRPVPLLQRVAWPFMMYFPKSRLTISALLPIFVGAVVGILVSIMGIGGGFIMVPAMIYLIGMPTNVVIGTSLFQIMLTAAYVTLLHAMTTQTVDIILASIMLTGSVIGAQLGGRFGTKLPADWLRAMLAFLVLIVVMKLAFGLLVRPSSLYEITEI